MESNISTLICFSFLTLGLAFSSLFAPLWLIDKFYRLNKYLNYRKNMEYPKTFEDDYTLLNQNPDAYKRKYSIYLKMFRLNGIFLLFLFVFGIWYFTQ